MLDDYENMMTQHQEMMRHLKDMGINEHAHKSVLSSQKTLSIIKKNTTKLEEQINELSLHLQSHDKSFNHAEILVEKDKADEQSKQTSLTAVITSYEAELQVCANSLSHFTSNVRKNYRKLRQI